MCARPSVYCSYTTYLSFFFFLPLESWNTSLKKRERKRVDNGRQGRSHPTISSATLFIPWAGSHIIVVVIEAYLTFVRLPGMIGFFFSSSSYFCFLGFFRSCWARPVITPGGVRPILPTWSTEGRLTEIDLNAPTVRCRLLLLLIHQKQKMEEKSIEKLKIVVVVHYIFNLVSLLGRSVQLQLPCRKNSLFSLALSKKKSEEMPCIHYKFSLKVI